MIHLLLNRNNGPNQLHTMNSIYIHPIQYNAVEAVPGTNKRVLQGVPWDSVKQELFNNSCYLPPLKLLFCKLLIYKVLIPIKL